MSGSCERLSRMSGSGREDLPNVREWSGGPSGYPGVVRRPSLMTGSVGRPSLMTGSCREALSEARKAL